MTIKMSQNAAEILHPTNLGKETNNLQEMYENVKKQVEAQLNILNQPEVIKSEIITAFRKAVKQEAENCINCKEGELLSQLVEKFYTLDLKSLRELKYTPTNNSNYRPKIPENQKAA